MALIISAKSLHHAFEEQDRTRFSAHQRALGRFDFLKGTYPGRPSVAIAEETHGGRSANRCDISCALKFVNSGSGR